MPDTRHPHPPPWAPEPISFTGGDARSVALRVAAALVLVAGTGIALLSVNWATAPPAADGLDEALAEIQEVGPPSAAGFAADPMERGGAVLDVDAPVPGSTVFVNGDSVGTTPARVRLDRLGEQWVVISHGGRSVLDTTVWVAADEALALSAPRPETRAPVPDPAASGPPVAAPSSGTLRVVSTPAGAQVLLDGRRAGTTPLTLDEVPPGRYALVVRQPGHETVTRHVRIRGGTRYEVDLALRPSPVPSEPPAPPPPTVPTPPRREVRATTRPDATEPMGTVEVRVHPRGRVEIDGRVRVDDSDALYRTDLPVGEHRIRVSHPQWGVQERTVVVDRGVTYRLTFTLDGSP